MCIQLFLHNKMLYVCAGLCVQAPETIQQVWPKYRQFFFLNSKEENMYVLSTAPCLRKNFIFSQRRMHCSRALGILFFSLSQKIAWAESVEINIYFREKIFLKMRLCLVLEKTVNDRKTILLRCGF